MTRCVIALALAASACMPAPPELINDSAIPNSAFAQLHRQVEALAQADIPLWDFTIHIYVDVDQFLEDCRAPAAEGIGFTNTTSKIWLLAAEDIPLPDVAAAVAHQLGHVHFEQGAKDPDWGHSRVEWFGEGGIVDRIWGLVAEEYGL